MERKLIANHLVPDDEVWVSPATWERPFSLKAKESTVTDTQQLKAEISKVLSQSEPYHMYNGETGYRLTKLQYEKLLKLSAV